MMELKDCIEALRNSTAHHDITGKLDVPANMAEAAAIEHLERMVDLEGERNTAWKLVEQYKESNKANLQEVMRLRSLLRRALPILEDHDCGLDCEILEHGPNCPVPSLRVLILETIK